VTSNEAAATANDRLFVEVRHRSGRVLATLATFSNMDLSAPGNYTLRGNYNLARFAGQTVRIQFRTTTDSSAVTNFRVDDVSVK
jgi:bacillolysin